MRAGPRKGTPQPAPRATPGRDEFDVCVVGTGAGGGVMIDQLTAAGFRVVALQRGLFLQPSDFDDDEIATRVRGRRFAADAVETYRLADGVAAVPGRYGGAGHCVGGSTAFWSAWAFRFRPDEFRVLTTEGSIDGASLADWPFGYRELEPWYDRAELDFGVAGDVSALAWGMSHGEDYPNPPHPGRASTERIARAARTLGWRPFPIPVAINSLAYGGRSRCLYGGNCRGFGCPVHAKATTLSVSIARALRTGKLDLRPNAFAREIALGRDGRARSVRYLDWKGREQQVFARQVVLAGNAIGSAHLLLLSRSGSFPEGLANSSGLVGKNLCFQMVAAAAWIADEPALGAAGFDGHVAVDDLHVSTPRRGFVRGGVVAESNVLRAQPIAWALGASGGNPAYERAWGKRLKDYLRAFPRAVTASAVLEDLPMETNAVDLDPNVKDRFGVPLPRITHAQHANDLAMHGWFGDRLLELADAAGAREKWLVSIPGLTVLGRETAMTGGLSLLGTCRMGEDPAKSVLDPWCRTHDVKNLWVVDGSAFPTPGGYPPGLTILANAYRVADHFIAEAKAGNA